MMKHTHPIEQFHFPMDIFKYKTIRNIAHFHQMINRQNNLSKRNVIFQPTKILGSDGVQTLTLQCKNQCQAYFKYICPGKGQNFSLKDYNQKHQHVLKHSHTSNQSIIDRINKFLQNSDNKQDLNDLKYNILKQYSIQSKQFDQLYTQAFQRLKKNNQLFDSKQIQQLIKRLKAQRYGVIVDSVAAKFDRQYKNIIKSVLIISDLMSANYKKYGQCCYFTVEEKHHYNRWYVGAFMGIGRDMEMTTFAIFLMKAVDTEHLKGVVKTFINSNDKKPETFITQSHFYYDQVFMQLRQQNILDSQHIYDYAIQCDRLHKNNPKFKKIFSELSRQPLKKVFFDKLQQYFNNQNFHQLEIDLQQLANIADKFCLSQIKAVPVGPYRSIKNKNSQKINDFSIIRYFHKIIIEKQSVPNKHLYNRIKNIINMLSITPNEQCADKNRIMDLFPQLLTLKAHVTRNVMQHINNKVYASVQYRSKKIDEDTYQVFGNQQYFYVRRQNQQWNCQCQQSVKTMLPCVHEVLTCCLSVHSFSTQIKRRWGNQDKILEQQLRRKVYQKRKPRRQTLSEFLA